MASQHPTPQNPGPRPPLTVQDLRRLVTSPLGLLAVLLPAAVTLVLGLVIGNGTASSEPGSTVTVTAAPPAPTWTTPSSTSPPSSPPTSPPTSPPSNPPTTTAGSEDLSSQKRLSGNSSVDTGQVQIGTSTFPTGIRHTCGSPCNSVYNVVGYKFLDTTIGFPNDAPAAGDTAVVTFRKDGSQQLGQPISIQVGSPQRLHLDLAGSTQLEIDIVITSNTTHGYVYTTLAFGSPTLTQT